MDKKTLIRLFYFFFT